MSTLLSLIVKGILGLFIAILERLTERQRQIQKGRDEVLEAVKKREQEIDQALEELRDTPSTDDDDINFLRNRSNRRKNSVPGNNVPNSRNR
jgi:hypothetical protein